MIDQTTFRRDAKPAVAAAPAAVQRRPVVVLSFVDPDSDWPAALAQAITMTLAHHPDAAFDVTTPLPVARSQAEQDAFVATGAADAARVARQMQVDGVSADRIAIRSESDPGSPAREVRLYVR